MAPGTRSKFGSMFEPQVFRKQMYFIGTSLQYLWHCSDFSAPPAVIRRPQWFAVWGIAPFAPRGCAPDFFG